MELTSFAGKSIIWKLIAEFFARRGARVKRVRAAYKPNGQRECLRRQRQIIRGVHAGTPIWSAQDIATRIGLFEI